jgi:hypothetical protein
MLRANDGCSARSASKTRRLMDANQFAAFGAEPFLYFAPDETPDPDFIYRFEVIDHAHCVLCPVSLVQVFQPGAGITIAPGGAMLAFGFGKLCAVF